MAVDKWMLGSAEAGADPGLWKGGHKAIEYARSNAHAAARGV